MKEAEQTGADETDSKGITYSMNEALWPNSKTFIGSVPQKKKVT